MNLLIVGSGGREHAIAWAFAKSKAVGKIFCANGNAGIAKIAHCVDIPPTDILGLADFAVENEIDLTFVGGEASLALGIVDEFQSRGLKIIGAGKSAARLESSKAFAKDFMAVNGIPTAKYRVAETVGDAIALLDEFADAVVVKADGLAAGKGVVVASNRAEAVAALETLEEVVGSEAMNQIVLEERLEGPEVSLLLFYDGESFALMPPVRDHKRVGEGDTGANTGGMGTFSDDRILSPVQLQEIVCEIVEPTLRGCVEAGFPFCGILFIGLMLTESGPKVLEYNVRFGDPETQSILVRLDTELLEICLAMVEKRMKDLTIKWKPGASACVVLASENYPAKPKVGDVISGTETVRNALIFHAGTALGSNGELVTAGGRVLGVTATGSELSNALEAAYDAVNGISWRGMQFRRDIGKIHEG